MKNTRMSRYKCNRIIPRNSKGLISSSAYRKSNMKQATGARCRITGFYWAERLDRSSHWR